LPVCQQIEHVGSSTYFGGNRVLYKGVLKKRLVRPAAKIRFEQNNRSHGFSIKHRRLALPGAHRFDRRFVDPEGRTLYDSYGSHEAVRSYCAFCGHYS
jgi:hypothetical protein